MTTINVTTASLNLTSGGMVIARAIQIKSTRFEFYGKKTNITLTSLNTTPLASANSSLGLNLDNVPQVEDQSIYQALLQIHSALDVLIEAVNDLRLNKADK